MAEILKIEEVDRSMWRSLAPTFSDYNYRQIWEYGLACAARKGAVSEHIAIHANGELVGLADVRIRTVPWIGGGIAYISGGPLTQRYAGAQGIGPFELAVKALIAEYVHNRHYILRIQAPVGKPHWNEEARECLRAFGFKPASGVREYSTILVDTSDTLDNIRSRFSSNWRKNLTRAEKRGVEIHEGKDLNRFEPVDRLFEQLVQRKGIYVDLGASFYHKLQEELPEADRFTVFLSEIEGETVGMLVVSILGDIVVGLIAATSELGANRNASYLMYWRVLELAHSLGKSAFDLAGIDPEGNPSVYNFKRGFRGTEVIAAGPLQFCPKGIRYPLILLSERSVRYLGRLRRRTLRTRILSSFKFIPEKESSNRVSE